MSGENPNMKSLGINVLMVLIGIVFAYILLSSDETPPSDSAADNTEKEIAYWVAPMDPSYQRDGPGKSPMGMDLVPVYVGEEQEGEDAGFSVSPNVLASLGVKTALAEVRDFHTEVIASGRIIYDETQKTQIQIRSEGWIESLEVRAAGETVEKGELLFTFYSPDIANALSEYGQAGETGSERLQTLTRSRLYALGLNSRMIAEAEKVGDWSAPIKVFAPRSGVVTKLGVRLGSLVKKNTVAFEVTDLSNLWLIADVFESQAADIFEGQSVVVSGVGFHGKGSVDYIYPELDPMHQTVRVRANIPNEGGALKVGQFYEVRLASKVSRRLTVPDTAVIRLGSSNRVILDRGDGRFQAAEVELGATSAGRTVIEAGLSDGERVVVSGQFMLDSESSFTGAELRMEAGTEQGGIETSAFAMGTINSVDPENRVVNISHTEIAEIGWPAMTMDMSVADDLELDGIPVPAEVHFGVGQLVTGGYIITVIHVLSSEKEGMKP